MDKVVLIVDDEELNREVYKAQFEDDYTVLEAEDGEDAMRIIQANRNRIAVMLLDLNMPNKGGFEVLDFMKFNDYKKNIPVIMVTGDKDQESEIRALQKGADDFLTKGADSSVVRQRVANMIELYECKRNLEQKDADHKQRFKEVSSVMRNVLKTVLQARNGDSPGITDRIGNYTKTILEFLSTYWDEFYALPPDEIDRIVEASALHDIGEVAVPETIFAKWPLLTPEEQRILQSHTTHGCRIVSSMKSLEDDEYIKTAEAICRYHHERWDGSGYPDHLSGDDIPVAAQVVGLADTYEGLRSGALAGRCYSHDAALDAIERGEFGGFSPVLTEACKVLGDRLADIHDDVVCTAEEASWTL